MPRQTPNAQTPSSQTREPWNVAAPRLRGAQPVGHWTAATLHAVRRSPVRGLVCAGLLAMLAACSSGPSLDQAQLAARYAARSPANYRPPGPPSDPWGPYIRQASARFDVPQQWIRAVMQQESGGQEYLGGHLTTSPDGAMGLMQVMPDTYEELRARNSLGPDPYNPRDNILAGTAYIREMYDLYGSPGFLAAYNAGPGRYDDYLNHREPLPYETRQYVASIEPHLGYGQPRQASPAQQFAMNRYPVPTPTAPRPYPVQVASALPITERRTYATVPVATTSLPQPPAPPMMVAQLQPPRPRPGFQLVSQAQAATMPLPARAPLAGTWAIQVGAFTHPAEAAHAAAMARSHAAVLRIARTFVGQVHVSQGVLYRARLVGLSHEAALRGCESLRGYSACIVLSPAAQS